MTLNESAKIRRFEYEDLDDIFEIYSCSSVIENTSQMPFLNKTQVKELFEQPERHTLVVEIESKVVGHVTLFLSNKPRVKHKASLAIAIHPDSQGKGLGKLLMLTAIEQADKWLNIVRIELDVYTDNTAAIGLYKSLGFIDEGVKKMDSFKNGKYADLLLMARISAPR